MQNQFKPATLAKLNRFSNAIANEIKTGLATGNIRRHGFGDAKSETKKFLSMYKDELTQRFGVNVANILKTTKQLKFVLGSIAWRLGDKA